MADLRCSNGIKFGEINVELDYVEFSCRSNRCGKETGVVIKHRFSLTTGELRETLKFAEPKKGRER